MKILMVSVDKDEPGGAVHKSVISDFVIHDTGVYAENLNQIKYEIYKRAYDLISISDPLNGDYTYEVRVERTSSRYCK